MFFCDKTSIMSCEKEQLLQKIKLATQKKISCDVIASLKTNSGNTQQTERVNIDMMRDVLNDLGVSYKEAGSQQSKDFRDVGGIGINLEIKKTDSNHIYFNDTCPSSNIDYIIFYTGKKYKNKEDIPPMILFVNGEEFLKDTDEWLPNYQRKLEELKNEFSRGENKKNLGGILEVYPRPTYKADISKLIQNNIATLSASQDLDLV